MSPEKILTLADLHALLGRNMTMESFANWVVKAKDKDSFPVQIVLTERSSGWRLSEVEAWIESRPRSAAARSPNKRRRPRRLADLTAEEVIAILADADVTVSTGEPEDWAREYEQGPDE